MVNKLLLFFVLSIIGCKAPSSDFMTEKVDYDIDVEWRNVNNSMTSFESIFKKDSIKSNDFYKEATGISFKIIEAIEKIENNEFGRNDLTLLSEIISKDFDLEHPNKDQFIVASKINFWTSIDQLKDFLIENRIVRKELILDLLIVNSSIINNRIKRVNLSDWSFDVIKPIFIPNDNNFDEDIKYRFIIEARDTTVSNTIVINKILKDSKPVLEADLEKFSIDNIGNFRYENISRGDYKVEFILKVNTVNGDICEIPYSFDFKE